MENLNQSFDCKPNPQHKVLFLETVQQVLFRPIIHTAKIFLQKDLHLIHANP